MSPEQFAKAVASKSNKVIRMTQKFEKTIASNRGTGITLGEIVKAMPKRDRKMAEHGFVARPINAFATVDGIYVAGGNRY